ncbi:MAG TPA: NAD(P)-dependent oxidoreductase [Afifellaceae bacterium]|nr:NAD(P)-dependent oxidoreductase [Afifellaceae bacterium]
MGETVGILGLGIMGSAIAPNLMKAGFDVVGYDPLAERRAALEAAGGRSAASPQAVAEAAPIVISLLPSSAALEHASLGNDGLAAAGRDGLTLVECSTLPIAAKEAVRAPLAEGGVAMLDCPLSGTGAQAANKDLVAFASGEEAAFEAAKAALHGYCKSALYLGPFGNGSKMKFVANLLVSIHNVAAAEALTMGMKAGLDPQLVYDAVIGGAGSSRMFEVRGPLMVAESYDEATMKNEVWMKDIAIITEFARSLGTPTPLFAASAELYSATMAQGRNKQDTAAVCAVVEEMARVKRR